MRVKRNPLCLTSLLDLMFFESLFHVSIATGCVYCVADYTQGMFTENNKFRHSYGKKQRKTPLARLLFRLSRLNMMEKTN